MKDGGAGYSSCEAGNDRGAKNWRINLAGEGNHDCTQHRQIKIRANETRTPKRAGSDA